MSNYYRFEFEGRTYFVEWVSSYRGFRDYSINALGCSEKRRIREEGRSSWSALDRRAAAEVKRRERADLREMCASHKIPYSEAMRSLKRVSN